MSCSDTYIAEYITLTHLHGDGFVVAKSLAALTMSIDVHIIEWDSGFSERNLSNIRKFYLCFPNWQTLSAKLSRLHYTLLLGGCYDL
jgi:hypothetical protein